MVVVRGTIWRALERRRVVHCRLGLMGSAVLCIAAMEGLCEDRTTGSALLIVARKKRGCCQEGRGKMEEGPRISR